MSEREVQLEAELTLLRQKLRAISDALHEYCRAYLVPAGVIAALFSRIRAIVEGK